MRKIIIVPLALVIIYCILWFVVASVIESKVKESIDGLNSDKVQVIGDYVVKVSGFPFDFSLKLSKPHFRFTENGKNVRAVYDIQFNGDFELSVSWLIKSIDLVSTGGISIQGDINDYKFNINADASESTKYKVILRHTPLYGDGLKTVMALGDKPEGLFSLIKEVGIKAVQCNIKTVNGGQSLLSADKLQLNIESYKDQDKVKFSIKQDVVNAKFTNAALNLWQFISKTQTVSDFVNKMNPDVRNYFSVFTLPQLGNMNYFLDIDYKGDLLASDFKLNVNKLKLQDNVMNIVAKGDVESDSKTLNLDLTSDSNFSELWYQLMKQYAQTFRTTTSFSKTSGAKSVFGVLADAIKSSFVANSANVYSAYVPQLQTFGQIHNHAKLQVKSSDNANYDVAIKDLTFEVEPYSLKLSGSLQQKGQQQAYNIKLLLNSYGIILSDAFGYAQRITSAIGKKFFIGGSALDLSPHSRGEIQSFIKQISDEPTSNSVNITISANKSLDKKYPAVGQYSSQEFGFLWNKLFTELLINESTDKIKQFLPEEAQSELQKHIDKIAPIANLLSSFK